MPRKPDTDSGRSILGSVRSVVGFFLSLVTGGLSFLGRQATGTWRRTRAFLGWLSFDRLMPSGLAATIQEVIVRTVQALGIRGTSRQQQFASAVILGVFAYGATLLTGGLLIGVALFLTLLVFTALARNNPWFNKQWKAGTSKLPVKNDYDLKGWSRD